jgi:hypothetical protein
VEKPVDIPTASHHDDASVPRFEPWLGVAAAAFVPLSVMFVLPPSFLLPMIGLAGLLLLAGIVMLIRQERGVKPEA